MKRAHRRKSLQKPIRFRTAATEYTLPRLQEKWKGILSMFTKIVKVTPIRCMEIVDNKVCILNIMFHFIFCHLYLFSTLSLSFNGTKSTCFSWLDFSRTLLRNIKKSTCYYAPWLNLSSMCLCSLRFIH